jgi:hypothetical protein
VTLSLRTGAVLFAAAAVAAGPPADLVRRANDSFARGDIDAADHLYADAAEWTADPGLVAFNRAAVLFARGEFRDAELHYLRALADAAVPAERRKRALFNRGVCLLKRGGPSSVYRSAINSFDGCLDADPGDPALDADARHNLEVAKVLWGQARASEATPPKANDPLADDLLPPPLPGKEPVGPEDGDDPGGSAGKKGVPEPAPGPGAKDRPAEPTDGTAPGSGSLPVVPDAEVVVPLSPEDTRALLKRAAARVEKDRRATTRLLAGPERPHVRDW